MLNKFPPISLLISSMVFAQTEPTTTTTTKIKVYSPTSSQKTSSISDSYKWTLKTDILGFASGEFPLIGEYKISKKMSVEASAGVTYGNLFYSFFRSDDNKSSFSSQNTFGNAFRLGLKYYPSSDYDAIEGWGFGVQLFRKVNNREYTPVANFDLSDKKSFTNKTGIAVTISKQIFWDSDVCFEYFLGIGFAKITDNYAVINDYNNNLNVNIPVQKEETKNAPDISIGFRIGFGK